LLKLPLKDSKFWISHVPEAPQMPLGSLPQRNLPYALGQLLLQEGLLEDEHQLYLWSSDRQWGSKGTLN